MSKIDPTRLSRVLAALARPKEPVTSSAFTQAAPGKSQNAGKSLETLKTRLHGRIKALQPDAEGFRDAAPVVTIQEILCWEFGDGILEHSDFKQIAQQVTQTMMSEPKLEKTIRTIIDEALSGK
ncbi:hypothetical protein [Pseudomonas marginalis]|jgi:hypothetical protein|uniref:hypothetical protein n=1 Tax=Pseudomonas marginalis TaxID=298 RepID=UPI002480E502|nr:hypothetical protein [Pseudomonas marginalis]WGT26674.1 hypothetical protein QGQ83_23825 [Pseudomonas marginalis]